MLRKWFGVVVLSACVSTPRVEPSKPSFIAGLRGEWQGVLEYKDYQQPDRRVTLPTLLAASGQGDDAVVLDFTFDDGPGKTVKSSEVLSLKGTQLQWGKTQYTVLEQTPSTLTVEAMGEDDNAPAVLHEVFTVSPQQLIILKTVKPLKDGAFSFRHEYRLQRVSAGAPGT